MSGDVEVRSALLDTVMARQPIRANDLFDLASRQACENRPTVIATFWAMVDEGRFDYDASAVVTLAEAGVSGEVSA